MTEGRRQEALLAARALQSAIFNSANFASIATDAKGVIQIFNVGAERMLGYSADKVVNKITPADISAPQETIARAEALSVELGTPIAPGFEALVFKASRGIKDIYELTYIREDDVIGTSDIQRGKIPITGEPDRGGGAGLRHGVPQFPRNHLASPLSQRAERRQVIDGQGRDVVPQESLELPTP